MIRERTSALWVNCIIWLLFLTHAGFCEERVSVVVLKTDIPAEISRVCQETIDSPFLAVRGLKINGKGEVKAVALTAEGRQPVLTRQEYEHARSINLKEFSQLEIREGLLYGLTRTGETLLLFPQDKKPDKNISVPLTEMYRVSLEGQIVAAKAKDKRTLEFGRVWKIFNLDQADPPEAALFQHAAQENKAAIWKGYIRNIREYKLAEALAGLRETLAQCVADSLQTFAQGNYASIKTAETAALEAKGIDDSEVTQALLTKVKEEQKHFQDLIALASSLVQSAKWDDALTALEPLKKYLTQTKELDAAHAAANNGSYDFHFQTAKDKLRGNNLAEALKEYEVALNRKPDSSEAQSGRTEALVGMTIADSRQLRQHKKPAEAREQILNTLSTERFLADDPRIAAELKLANCEFSAQLFSEAQKSVLSPTKNL